MTSPTLLDPSRCPLCQRTNGCAIAAGLPAAQCWCMQQPIAPAALAQLPPSQRNQACLCAFCGQGLPSSEQESGDPPATPI